MSNYTTPTLYLPTKPGASRPWLMSETPGLFSLANLGSYNQRLINQLLLVGISLSSSVAFLPLLTLPALKALERTETLYANGQPYHTETTINDFDFAGRQPSDAEAEVVRQAIATTQYLQAVPLLSYSFTISLLRRVLEELEVFSDAAECLEAETDTHGNPIWRSTSETATYYGLSADSTEYWNALELLQSSIQVYAKDKELMLDA